MMGSVNSVAMHLKSGHKRSKPRKGAEAEGGERKKKKEQRTSGLRAIGCPVVTSKLPPSGPSLPATSTEAGLRLAPIPEPWYRLLMCLYDSTDFKERSEVKRKSVLRLDLSRDKLPNKSV